MTGGANGIGKAFCHELAKQGFNIMIMDKDRRMAESLAADLKMVHSVEVS